MLEIAAVLPGGTASRLGLLPGDRLVSINGREVRDSIDFQYLASDERIVLQVERRDGSCIRLRFGKSPDDTLGLEFAPFAVRRCRNKCLFCFVDQMPPGCRRSLSVKDDDYRASFLFGNYITLSNLREEDWDRIFAQRLSPLYISVHATEPELRARLLNNARASDILASLRRLASGGIRVHTQIVLCPGINDGVHLERTVRDLAGLVPAVLSIAAVPVGLTAWRRGLPPLRAYRRAEAARTLAMLLKLGRSFRRRLGTRLVYPSDELILRSGAPVPPPGFYEDFPQIENGVGMVAAFLQDVRRTRLPRRVSPPLRMTAVTGRSFAPFLREAFRRLETVEGVSARVLQVGNRLFGPSVTVTGLLSGSDIMRSIAGRRLGDLLLVPENTLKEGQGVFLDDRTVEELAHAAGIPVRVVGSFSDVVQVVRHERRQRGTA